MLKFISENEFDNTIKDADFIIIDFFATWCMPCQMLGQELEKLSQKFEIAKIDIDNAHDLAYKFGIEAVPTMLVFKKGEQVGRIEGYYSENELEEKLNEWL